MGTVQALAELKQRGEIGAFGISTKTVAGGQRAAQLCDLVMLTYNLVQREEAAVLDACQALGKGTLIKKALASGHLDDIEDPVHASMELVLGHPATGSAVIGTITPAHLQANVAMARAILGE
jgi:aryl-alcohol dehydrogenase-like predicted oxidoreductase